MELNRVSPLSPTILYRCRFYELNFCLSELLAFTQSKKKSIQIIMKVASWGEISYAARVSGRKRKFIHRFSGRGHRRSETLRWLKFLTNTVWLIVAKQADFHSFCCFSWSLVLVVKTPQRLLIPLTNTCSKYLAPPFILASAHSIVILNIWLSSRFSCEF